VADIDNVLRHVDNRVAPDILWALVQRELPELGAVCRKELAEALRKETGRS